VKVEINKENWSEESKRSYSYDSPISCYQDENYKCYKCGESSVFTAEEQKYSYEVKKNYIWKKRVLCQNCFSEYEALTKKICEFENAWGCEPVAGKGKALYLQEWLSALNEVPSFGKPKNEAVAIMISKRIEKIPNE
jgi:hypothetical protein